MNGHIFDATGNALFQCDFIFFFSPLLFFLLLKKDYNDGNMNICKSQDLLHGYSHCPTDENLFFFLVINTERFAQPKNNKRLLFFHCGEFYNMQLMVETNSKRQLQ